MGELPLGRHPLCRTFDLDESRAVFSRINTPIHCYTSGRSPYAWRSNHVVVGGMTLAANEWADAGGARSEEVQDIFSLDFPLGPARGEGDHDGETVPYVGDEEGIILSPGMPAVARIEAGFRVLEVVVRREELESSLTALVGPGRRAPLRFAPRVTLRSGPGRSLFQLVQSIAALTEHDDGVITAPLVAARLSDSVLFGLLLGLRHNHSARLAAVAHPAEPRYVRRAAEYLEAHAAQAIRMIDLAAVTGVSVRALQIGFLKYRGMSPMAFLRERRLVRARTRLLASPHGSIAHIAIDCGFEHLGRFSVAYRARFGETPSATRRRAF